MIQHLNIMAFQRYAILIVLLLSSCLKDDVTTEGIYFHDPTNRGSNEQTLAIDDTGGTMEFSLASSVLVPSTVVATVRYDPKAVETYNKKNSTTYQALPEKYLDLPTLNMAIEAGQSRSKPLTLNVLPFGNDVKESDQFLIPITITEFNSQVPLLEYSKTLLVKVSRVLVNPALDVSKIGGSIQFNVPEKITDLRQFTVEFRVRNSSNFRNNMTLFYAYPTEIYSRFGDVVIAPNQLQIKYAGLQPASATGFTSNKWYHIAYVFDGLSNSFKIYVDGKLDATSSAPPNTAFTIESMGFGGSGLPIQVQELRFWTKPRTQSELASNMCSINPDSEGLLAYWKFNEGSGTIVKDVTGNGFNGSFPMGSGWIEGVRCPD